MKIVETADRIKKAEATRENWIERMQEEAAEFPPDMQRRIGEKINEVLEYCPRIGIFGKTGVGKSSLTNALFGKKICPISDVTACTREPKDVLLSMGEKGVTLVDVPGVGETGERDEEYAQLYAELMPELDVVLWVVKADDRALAEDEKFYQELVKPHIDQDKPFFFVLNQVNRIQPCREWNEEKHKPSTEQFGNIEKKRQTVADQFEVPVSKVLAVSAEEKYGMIPLVDEIIYSLPAEKRITAYRAVSDEFRTKKTSEYVDSSAEGFVNEVIEEWRDIHSDWQDLKHEAKELFVDTILIDGLEALGESIHDFFDDLFF